MIYYITHIAITTAIITLIGFSLTHYYYEAIAFSSAEHIALILLHVIYYSLSYYYHWYFSLFHYYTYCHYYYYYYTLIFLIIIAYATLHIIITIYNIGLPLLLHTYLRHYTLLLLIIMTHCFTLLLLLLFRYCWHYMTFITPLQKEGKNIFSLFYIHIVTFRLFAIIIYYIIITH